jgi:hypothetical protein
MMKWFLSMFFPLLLCSVRYVGEDGGGDGGDGGGAGGGGSGDGDGSGGGDGGVIDHGGGTHSRELNPGGDRKPAGGDGAKPWYEAAGLPSDLLTDKDKEYKTLADYVKGSQSARQLAASKGIPLPPKDATPEQQAAFKAEVMKNFPDLPMAPESADAYDIPMFKDENVGLAKERQQAIRSKFHSLGIGNKQASGVMDLYAEQVAADMAEAAAQIAAQRAETDKELKQAWGAEYPERMDGINRIGERYPELMSALKSVGIDARKDFNELMDEVARSVREDHPGGAGRESGESLDSQIKDLRDKIKKTENSHERGKLIEQQSVLYKKRDKMRGR